MTDVTELAKTMREWATETVGFPHEPRPEDVLSILNALEVSEAAHKTKTLMMVDMASALKTARNALKPIALIASDYVTDWETETVEPGEDDADIEIKFGDCRRARAALAQIDAALVKGAGNE